MTGARRWSATRANAPLISFDEAFKLVKINPLATWSDEDMQNYIDEHDVLVNPLVYEGYPSIGCASVHGQARRGRRPAQRTLEGTVQDRMRVTRVVTSLVLTAHGSADPRSAANARAVAGLVARMRPNLDVRLAFLDHCSPSLVEALAGSSGEAVVAPLLLANAYHARVDIPRQIASCTVAERVWRAPVLGEDDRLVSVLRRRVAEVGVSRLDETLGVLVVAIGTSDPAVNARTARVAPKLLQHTGWAGATTAFATQPERSLAEGIGRLRRQAPVG